MKAFNPADLAQLAQFFNVMQDTKRTDFFMLRGNPDAEGSELPTGYTWYNFADYGSMGTAFRASNDELISWDDTTKTIRIKQANKAYFLLIFANFYGKNTVSHTSVTNAAQGPQIRISMTGTNGGTTGRIGYTQTDARNIAPFDGALIGSVFMDAVAVRNAYTDIALQITPHGFGGINPRYATLMGMLIEI